MADSATIAIKGREVKLTNLDRVLWPDDGYTKRDLVEYYAAVFPFMGPHLKQRPLVFNRYPSGIKEDSFFQKNAPAYMPDWIKTYAWEGSEGKVKNYILAESQADMVWLANQACIEIHPWLSSTLKINYPDFIVFDIDPSEYNTLDETITVAKLLKETMDKLDLRVYLKTSGAKGLHIYLPVVAQYTYDQVRIFGQAIAELICKVVPDIATIQRLIQNRGKRIYIDYLQNGLGKTICAPYSVRPRSGATVSTPIKWEELSGIKPEEFTIKTVLQRFNKTGDQFEIVLNDRQELKKAAGALGISLESHE